MVLVISILVLLLSSNLFLRAGGTLSFRELNMISYIFYLMLVWTFIGSIMVFYDFGVVETRMPFDNVYVIRGWASIMYSMIAIPLGMLVVNKYYQMPSPKQTLANFKLSSWKNEFIGISFLHWKSGLYLISLLSFFVNIFLISFSWDSIPLVNLLFKDTSYTDVYIMRNNFRLIPFSNSFLNSIITTISSLTLISTYAFFIYFMIDKKKKDLIWFLSLLIISIAILTIDLNKGRSLFFLIGFLFLVSFFKGKIKWRTIIFSSAIGLLLVGFTYVFFMGAFSKTFNPFSLISFAFQAIKGRVLVTQISGLYYCFDIFPEKLPFIGFSSTGRFIHEILGLHFSPDYGLLVRYLTVKGAGISGSGQYTTMFLGEAWSNFGYIGLIISPIVVGLFIQSINIFFLKLPKSPLTVGIYTQLAINFPILSGFRSFYYPAWVLEYLIMFSLIYIIVKVLSFKHKFFIRAIK